VKVLGVCTNTEVDGQSYFTTGEYGICNVRVRLYKGFKAVATKAGELLVGLGKSTSDGDQRGTAFSTPSGADNRRSMTKRTISSHESHRRLRRTGRSDLR